MTAFIPATSNELQQLTTDLVASPRSNRGPLEHALQQALSHSIESKVKAHLSVILEGIGDAFYSLDGNWRFTYINRAAEAFFETPRDRMLGQVLWELFPESEGTELRRKYEEVVASGTPASFEAMAVTPLAVTSNSRSFPTMAASASASATGRSVAVRRKSCARAKRDSAPSRITSRTA